MSNTRIFAAVSLTGRDQTADSFHQIVKLILGRSGCPACGRIARLLIDFQVDPSPEFAKLGVHTFEQEGLNMKV